MIGTRVGQGSAMAGFGLLIGGPSAGAILAALSRWIGPRHLGAWRSGCHKCINRVSTRSLMNHVSLVHVS